jgi:hypothetical protein
MPARPPPEPIDAIRSEEGFAAEGDRRRAAVTGGPPLRPISVSGALGPSAIMWEQGDRNDRWRSWKSVMAGTLFVHTIGLWRDFLRNRRAAAGARNT